MATPFSIVQAGEAAGVVLLRAPESDAWMRDLAAFLRLPVLAFVRPAAGGFDVRLFAAGVELDFSGTGLAAAAHALWHAELLSPGSPAELVTASGRLAARRTGTRLEVLGEGRVIFATVLPRTVARGQLSWPP